MELTETLLHAAGKTPNKGSVDAGTTVSDSAREIHRFLAGTTTQP